jgi:hypothetical protein
VIADTGPSCRYACASWSKLHKYIHSFVKASADKRGRRSLTPGREYELPCQSDACERLPLVLVTRGQSTLRQHHDFSRSIRVQMPALLRCCRRAIKVSWPYNRRSRQSADSKLLLDQNPLLDLALVCACQQPRMFESRVGF